MTNYKYRLIGTGTTNAQGIATLEKDPNNTTITGYTGAGAGKLQIIATNTNTPFTDDTIYSEVKEILDCWKYDEAKSGEGKHDDSVWVNTNGLQRDTDETYIAPTSDFPKSITITDNVCIEIDVKIDPQNVDTSSNSYLQFATFAINSVSEFACRITNLNLTPNEYQHFKILIQNGRIELTNETTPITPITGTLPTINSFLLRTQANTKIFFKEVKIYPI